MQGWWDWLPACLLGNDGQDAHRHQIVFFFAITFENPIAPFKVCESASAVQSAKNLKILSYADVVIAADREKSGESEGKCCLQRGNNSEVFNSKATRLLGSARNDIFWPPVTEASEWYLVYTR